MRISATVTISTVYPGTIGGAIFCGRDAAGTYLRFVADCDCILRAPIVGEVWSLEGESRRHSTFGDQVHVQKASLVQPTGRLLIDFLLKHPAFDGLGIGKAKAARLWAEFGPGLHILLNKGDVEKLSYVVSEEMSSEHSFLTEAILAGCRRCPQIRPL